MGAKSACANHPERRAAFECAACQNAVCVDCTNHRWSSVGFVDDCLGCGGTLSAIATSQGSSTATAEPGIPGFIQRIPDFLLYPVNKSVLAMCIGLALINAPLYWAIQNNLWPIFGFLGLLIAKSLELSLYFRFVTESAYGKENPDPPDFGDLQDDLLFPLFRYLAATAPIVIGIFIFSNQFLTFGHAMLALETKPTLIFEQTVPAILVSAGLILLPLLTVIAAMSGSFLSVVNPSLWIRSLQIFGGTYAIASGAFYLVFAFEQLFLLPLLTDMRIHQSIPVVTSVLTLAVSYLAMALKARILGGLCEPYFRDFD